MWSVCAKWERERVRVTEDAFENCGSVGHDGAEGESRIGGHVGGRVLVNGMV